MISFCRLRWLPSCSSSSTGVGRLVVCFVVRILNGYSGVSLFSASNTRFTRSLVLGSGFCCREWHAHQLSLLVFLGVMLAAALLSNSVHDATHPDYTHAFVNDTPKPPPPRKFRRNGHVDISEN